MPAHHGTRRFAVLQQTAYECIALPILWYAANKPFGLVPQGFAPSRRGENETCRGGEGKLLLLLSPNISSSQPAPATPPPSGRRSVTRHQVASRRHRREGKRAGEQPNECTQRLDERARGHERMRARVARCASVLDATESTFAN